MTIVCSGRMYLLAALACAWLHIAFAQADETTTVTPFMTLTNPVISVNGVSSVVVNRTHVVTEVQIVTTTGNAIVSAFPVTVTTSGSRYVKTETVTLGLTPPTALSDAREPTQGSHANKGAIAGGVIGAVVVAATAAVLFMHFRNKRSPIHWRNQALPLGRWHHVESKAAQPRQPSASVHNPYSYGDMPFDGNQGDLKQSLPGRGESIEPATPVFIRAKHRPTASHQYDDPQSPLDASSSHQRTSSMGYGL